MALEMTPNVEWVGTIDWHERDFHGFTTERGVTYNAYLVRGERTALIDTVKARFAPAFVEELRNRTGGIGPHFVVCNHAEPDHAGGLPALMEAFPSTTLLCNAKCRDILAHHYAVDGWKVREVTHGEEISLGGRTLRFIDTPMLHWPESMATYLPEEKLLFSMDIFGQHVASSGRFDDEVRWCVTLDEAKSYFANIVQPYARKVPPLLETLRGLEMEIIAPSHGVVWRSRVAEILEAYEEWSSRVPRAKVLVLFDTMWESTERMAGAIVDGASAEGVEVVSLKVGNTHLARIATEALDAACVAMGSATLHRGMMPRMAAVLTYLKGLASGGKAGFSFGSFGWGRGGPEELDEGMRAMKWEILREPLRSRYRPDAETLEACREAGALLAHRAREAAGSKTERRTDS